MGAPFGLSRYLWPDAAQGRQPQYPAPIDWRASIARDLVFWVSGVGTQDVVSGRFGVPDAGCRRLVAKSGIVLNTPAGGGVRFEAYQPLKGGDFTILTVAAPEPSESYTQAYSQRSATWSHGSVGVLFNSNGIYPRAPGKLEVYISNGSNTPYCVSNGSVVDGEMRVFVATLRGTALSLYVDGKQIAATQYGAGSTYYNPAQETAIGCWGGVPANSQSTSFLLSAAWKRALSADEIAFVSANLWQVNDAPVDIPLFVSAAGAGGGLVAAPSSQSNVSSAGSIAQIHTLSAASGTQSNQSASIVITQTHQLSAPSCAQENNCANGSVTQAHQLSVSNSTQSNTSPGVVISTVGSITLTASNVAQANACATGAITQAHQLAAAGSAQANASSVCLITQTHTLTAAASSQQNGSVGGAVALGVVITLAAAPSAQANASSSATITQAHQLVCAPSVQDNIAAASAIVQAHMLAAANCVQSNKSLAVSIGAGGGSVSLSQADIDAIADAVFARITAATLNADVRRVNGVQIKGSGVAGDTWGPA